MKLPANPAGDRDGPHRSYTTPRDTIHVSAAHRMERAPATAPNEIWSMDFVSDSLFDGRRLRALTLLDVFTREALAIEADEGISGEKVVAILDAVLATRAAPQRIRVDKRSRICLERPRSLGL